MTQEEGIHFGGGWGEVHLIASGRQNENNTRRYPQTMRIIQKLGVEVMGTKLFRRVGLHIST